jgi:hypothetical protein
MDLKEFFSKNSHDIVEYNIWPVVGKDEVHIQHFMERRDILKPLYKTKVRDFKDFHKDVVMESYLKLIE